MNYREKRGAYLNCEKRMYPGVGPLGIPSIAPVNIDLTDIKVVGFNYAIGCKHPEDKVVHFFLDDYQFERVWNDPDRYISLLKRFRAVIAPDFSIYTDFPKVVQQFNHYRKHWCAAYWQEHGITVIPCIQWGLGVPESFDWCLDGEPRESTICVSTIGGFANKTLKDQYMAGWSEILKRLHPSQILLFGKHFPDIQFDGIMEVVGNDNLKNKATKSARPDREGDVQILVFDEKERLSDGQR